MEILYEGFLGNVADPSGSLAIGVLNTGWFRKELKQPRQTSVSTFTGLGA